MKILIIHGSPRRGNTWNILNKVREKINEEIINNYTFDNNSNGNIPVLNDGLITPMYEILNELAH